MTTSTRKGPSGHPIDSIDPSPQGDGIDLHSHTTASDGSLTPEQLIALAAESRLRAVAVTDHDTLDGLPDAFTAGARLGVEVVAGVEVSVDHPGRFHLLAYGFDRSHSELLERLTFLQDHRRNRNRRMVEKMQAHGLRVTWEEVEAEAGGDLIARPHMAMALLRKGLVSTLQDAFDLYLKDGGPCHVPKIKMTEKEAFGLFTRAGGITSVAHPMTLGMASWRTLERELLRLRDAGLTGLEVYYPAHVGDETDRLAGIADRLSLLKTGGSDFHGAAKPSIHLGGVIEGRPLPYSRLEELRARISSLSVSSNAPE